MRNDTNIVYDSFHSNRQKYEYWPTSLCLSVGLSVRLCIKYTKNEYISVSKGSSTCEARALNEDTLTIIKILPNLRRTNN